MVVKVRLEGLNIVKGRKPNTWYIYPRGGGEALVKGFEGTRAELIKKLGEPDFLQTYNRPRLEKRSAADFGAETLGGSIYWYTNGDIDRPIKEAKTSPSTVEGCYPKWAKLADATREGYLQAYDYLRPEFDMPLAGITQPDLYEVRDKCAVKKWPTFADHMITALSSMFKHAVKRGRMPFNVARGMEKLNTVDPNANREWLPFEWKYVRENAPLEVLIPCMIARYAGLRGQTIAGVKRSQFEDHSVTGKAVRYSPRKNKKKVREVLLPVMPELQAFLAELAEGKVQRADGIIAVRNDGSAWSSEKRMQIVVSIWLREQQAAGHIGAGTTLHGLRVSYAAWWRRNGATTREVADLIGDSSEAMGVHYTRHVEAEVNIIRAFSRIKGEQ
jgi:integrase